MAFVDMCKVFSFCCFYMQRQLWTHLYKKVKKEAGWETVEESIQWNIMWGRFLGFWNNSDKNNNDFEKLSFAVCTVSHTMNWSSTNTYVGNEQHMKHVSHSTATCGGAKGQLSYWVGPAEIAIV